MKNPDETSQWYFHSRWRIRIHDLLCQNLRLNVLELFSRLRRPDVRWGSARPKHVAPTLCGFAADVWVCPLFVSSCG
jgi:hypothetical protein